jgi:flagellar motor protein MotB
MKLVGVISTAVLFLLLGTTTPAYAQQHEEHAQQAKPAEHAQQQQHAQQAKPAEHAQQQQHAQQARPAQHAQQAQRVGGNRGGRIPDDRFRAHFGREHRFRIIRPTIVAGYPRFQYGGYWFGFIDPWPTRWHYTDDVYVDCIDGGYYLYNPVHPGIRIGINVVL